MTVGELIGHVAVIYLKNQLDSEPDGVVRFCMVGFGKFLTTEVAKAVARDGELSLELNVHIHKEMSIDSELPPEMITEETAAHWRNKRITSSDKRGILFAISTNELQGVGETIGTLSKLETDRLLENNEDWIQAVGLGGNQLQNKEFDRLSAALNAVKSTHLARNIEIFAEYVLKTGEFISQGNRVEHALDRALPALQLPRWAGGFEKILREKADASTEWNKRFSHLQSRIRPMLALENSDGDPIKDQVQQNFDELRKDLEPEEVKVVENFLLSVNLSLDQWQEEQKDLVDLDWRRVGGIFEGLEKTVKKSLGEATIEFFDHNFPEDIDADERDFLRQSLSPPPKDPTDDAKEFFDTHGESLSNHRKLYSQWERYIYRPQEYEDFIEGLVATLQRLQNFPRTKVTDVLHLRISISGKADKKLFWEEKNGGIMRYFASRYNGFGVAFDKFVTFNFGKLYHYYLPEEIDEELLEKTSRRKDACRLKFEMVLSNDGATESEKAVFFWRMQPDSIANTLTGDLHRLANQKEDHAILSTVDVSRQIASAKGQIQRVDLGNVNTLHDANNGTQGVLVDPNRSDGDICRLFKDNLKELNSSGIINDLQAAKVLNAMENFVQSYTKAIRDWIDEDGKGIASPYFLEQADDYEKLLSALYENADNDVCRERLWSLVLRIGVANIGGGEQAAIITPWQPLRMAELHIKLLQVSQLFSDVIKNIPEYVYRADIYYSQRLQEFRSAYYPEGCVGIDGGRTKLLVLTSNLGGYSLAELPNHEYMDENDEALDADPNTAARCFADISERYLDLLPHEKSNFSVVLFNAESKVLPKILADELSGKVEQEKDLRCDLFLTHTDQGRMRQIYEQQNFAAATAGGSVLSSETALNFLSRLRVGFIDPERDARQWITDKPNTRAVDLVFLQDVIARKAEQKWLRAPLSVKPEFLNHVPSRWSRRRPIAKGDTTSSVYLASPAQPKPCQIYLNALCRVISGGDNGLSDVIPVRQTSFHDSYIKDLFEQTHKIGEWVVNFDELVDRRLLRNAGIKVIRHINDRFVDRNIVVSTTSKPELLRVLLRKRLHALDPSFSEDDLLKNADKFIDQATDLSGQLVLRAARFGHYSNELLGVVLSMERLRRSMNVEGQHIGWYFLDDFATWFGQKEEKIADIMAIAPCVKNGMYLLKLAISEAKYVGSEGYQTHKKKSAQQLLETVNRISRALDPEKHRIDKDIWLHRVGDLMIENMELTDDLSVGGWNLHKWSEEVRLGNVPIFVAGFSHVFVHDEKSSVDAGVASIHGLNHCQQIVLDRNGVRDEVNMFAGKLQHSDIPEEAKKVWTESLISKADGGESQSVIDKREPEDEAGKMNNSSKTQRPGILRNAGITQKEGKKNDRAISPYKARHEKIESAVTEFSEVGFGADFSNWSPELHQWLRNGTNSEISTEKDIKWLHETEKSLQRALRGYDMTAEIRSSRLTPNAALIRFRGMDDLTVFKVERRKQELLTSHSIDVINVFPAPGEVVVMVKRPDRAVIGLRDLWRKRKLPSTAPQNNASLLLGICEEDGELLYLNFEGEFAGYQEHGPHTLIAGETGSGKGVLIQNMLLDICATNAPQNARVRMIDPKAGIDFPWLRQMPHLDRDLVTSQQEAICSIEELVEEMERRYQVFADMKVQKLGQHNTKVSAENRLSRIWLFHDEMADWMLSRDYREEVEKNVTRLGVKARAAGIHLVLITQRPDKEAMPVHLRANLANRLVLKVADRRNSELVLDEAGAEKLLGRGHLAAKLSGEGGKVILAQVPFANNDEISDLANIIADSWRENPNRPDI